MATTHAPAATRPPARVYPYTTTADKLEPGDHVHADLADPRLYGVSHHAGRVELTWHTSVGDPGQMPGQPRRRSFPPTTPFVVAGHTAAPEVNLGGAIGRVELIASERARVELRRRWRRGGAR
jgi:hypothetical protein